MVGPNSVLYRLFRLVGRCFHRYDHSLDFYLDSFMSWRPPLLVLHFYSLLSIALALIVQSMHFFSIPMPDWVSSYVKDVLVLPIVATICLHGVWILKKDKSIRLNIFTIFTLVVMYSFLFEYYFPKRIDFYVSDPWDVVCYAMGGIIFYFLQKIENDSFYRFYYRKTSK